MKILFVMMFGLAACSGGESNPTTPEASHKASAKTEYVCPMHPNQKSDKPGQTCSKCGMNLVAAKAHDHSSHEH